MIATGDRSLFQMWEEIGKLRTKMATEHDRLAKKYKVPMDHPKMKAIMAAYKDATTEFAKRLMINDTIMSEKNSTIAQLHKEKEKEMTEAKDELARHAIAIEKLQFENANLRGRVKTPTRELFPVTDVHSALVKSRLVDKCDIEQNRPAHDQLLQMKFIIGKMNDEVINQSFVIDELKSRLKESVMALMEYQAIYTPQPITDENMM